MNNDFFSKLQQLAKNPQALKTKGSVKFAVACVFGITPMLITWLIFRSSSGAFYDPLFMNISGIGFTPVVETSYGFMWLAAFIALFVTILFTYLVIRFDKNVKPDVFVPTIALAFVFANFYLFPYLVYWRLLTAVPMAMLGTMIAKTLLIAYFIYKAQKELIKMQKENPDMKFPGTGIQNHPPNPYSMFSQQKNEETPPTPPEDYENIPDAEVNKKKDKDKNKKDKK